MSMAQSLINQISANGLGGTSKPQSFDLNDGTFDDLLQKAIDSNKTDLNNNLRSLGHMGQPSGIIIEEFDNNPVAQTELQNTVSQTPIEIKDVSTDNNYFSNLLKEAPSEHKSIMEVAKKHAMGAYNAFGRVFVEDLTDFAKDVKSMI